MMLGKVEFRMNIKVALKTGSRILAWIDNKFTASATDANMFAGRAVAGFATCDGGKPDVVLIETAMHAGSKSARDIGVAIHARGVADKVSAGDIGRRIERALN